MNLRTNFDGFFRRSLAVLKVRKKVWLMPVVAILLILSLLIVFVQGGALAPLIYTVS
jgi:uncharacterized membrane protein YjdF